VTKLVSSGGSGAGSGVSLGVMPASLFATSDLHVTHQGNRDVVEQIRPEHEDDWLIVAGDVGDTIDSVEWALRLLRDRFSTVIWVPGNHELWTVPQDDVTLRGEARYRHLVELCRGLGVLTPEDPYPTWTGAGGPLVVAPLFLLYDYSWRTPGSTLAEAMADARASRVVCTDEFLLHPDPYPTRQDWAEHRLTTTRARLDALAPDARTVLVSHWPLHRMPTRILWYPQFAMWCGSERTEDWHRRYRADVAVYGHLHIPASIDIDGTRFEEVSLGYPREWRRRDGPPQPVRRILPADPDRTVYRPQQLMDLAAARRAATAAPAADQV
jgi:3',5'-cyclic AMP phosphodiesterase CpdA